MFAVYNTEFFNGNLMRMKITYEDFIMPVVRLPDIFARIAIL